MTRLLLSLLVIQLAAASGYGAERLRPNVLIVLADDLGWGDLSCSTARCHSLPCGEGGMRDDAQLYTNVPRPLDNLTRSPP